MCAIIVIGVIIFGVNSEQAKENHVKTDPADGGIVITVLLFVLSLSFAGLKPDFIAQVKQEYKPHPIFLYFGVNGVLFILIVCTSTVTLQMNYFISFVVDHNRILLDLTMYGILNSIYTLCSYKLAMIFRQHIYPLVANTKKCLTVCINVVWYGHTLALMQWLGIFLVFGAILLEVGLNFNIAEKIKTKYHKSGQ